MRLILASLTVAAAAVAPAGAQDAPRFFGHEAFTIVSELSGSQTGTVTTHVRDWGRLRVEIRDAEMAVMGFTQPDRQRVIYDGAQIISIDQTTGAATITDNPIYDSLVQAMDGEDGVSFGRRAMVAMGGQPTGASDNIAGQSCEYWSVARMAGQTVCVTEEGLTLATSTAMGPISVTQTATEVRLGDGGPDDAFDYDPDAVSTMPNLQDIMNSMGQGG